MSPEEFPTLQQVDREGRGGSLLLGCGMGCAVQIAFILLGVFLASLVKTRRMGDILAYSFGFTQWLAIIPLVISENKSGRNRVVAGLLISASMGLLLSSMCSGLAFGIR